mgnify:FL=1|tara:strand:+ start:4363 stop:4956 length:594 start_codon:yes stop_codon:yes gene_type:complete
MIFNFPTNLFIEALAVLFAVTYLLLAVKQDVKCWFAAIISSTLYFFIMYKAGLYMEAWLQIFYIVMAFYGIQQWTVTNNNQSKFIVRSWRWNTHFWVIAIIIILAIITGLLLEKFTNAALPFLDGLTTWGAIITTYMVAKRLLENWIYWFVIDMISIYLFLSRGLFLTAILFCIYLVIIFFGYRSWIKIRDENIKNA